MAISRNAPCPCGSGKKVKHCCGTARFDSPVGLAPRVNTDRQLDLAYQYFYSGRTQDAVVLCRQVLNLRPNSGRAVHLLGLVAHKDGNLAAAIDLMKKAAGLEPRSPFVQGNLGALLYQAGEADAAVKCFKKALSLDPSYVGTLKNLGNVERDRGNLILAKDYYERVLRQKPDDAGAWLNLGSVYKGLDLLDQSISCCNKALEIKPDYDDARFNAALVWLAKGELKKGWELYESRFTMENAPTSRRTFPYPFWQGENLSDKSLLVWMEQGVGDEIMLASMIPDVIKMARQVVLECAPRLASLFARSFPEVEVISRENTALSRFSTGDIDYQIPAGSLPRIFRSALELFPSQLGYLVPDSARMAHWKSWLDKLGPGLKVGISWRSMKFGMTRDMHYTQLSQWGEILKNRGVKFINLQYDDCASELEHARRNFGVEIHEAEGINLKDDLDDVAALQKTLDLVLSAGTTVAGIAGGVGVPTWMFTLSNNWTQLGTDHLPWMQSVKIYSKAMSEAWEPLLKVMACDLDEWSKKEQGRCP